MFKIKHFDDYHEIHSDRRKAIELGCFPVEEYGYCRYFGLFYTGRLPALSKILNSVKKKVHIGGMKHYRVDREIGITEKELKEEIETSIKQHFGP